MIDTDQASVSPSFSAAHLWSQFCFSWLVGRSFFAKLAVLGALALVGGCGISPVPSPPEDAPTLDESGLSLLGVESLDQVGIISFAAAPGTVDPAEGNVIITNLSQANAPSVVSVSADGSFAVAVSAFPSHVLRFQVVADTRSEPLDLRVDNTGTTLTVVEPVVECLEISPARWLGLDGPTDATSIVIRNLCDVPVDLGPPQFRRGQAGFSFSPTNALSLAPSEVGFITVSANGSAAEFEDVLLIDVLAPEVERRAITVSIP